jgi:DNA-binding transcriptional LysR family regulator
MHIRDWADLRYVLAVADGGSLAAAARALGVDHTTVLRRLAGFERALGARLFERRPSGYVPTPAGEALAATARQIRDEVAAVERRVLGADLQLTGTVRITTTDTLAHSLLPAALAGLAATHPTVGLELTTTNALLSLTHRDADVAVRPSAQPPPNLVGHKIATLGFAPYAAPRYLRAHPARRDLAAHRWIGPDDGLAGTAVGRWMRRTLPAAPLAARADSFTTLARLAAAGLGVAALPCYLGDGWPGLRRVRGRLADVTTELWVLTHADLRRTARVHAVMEHLTAALTAQRARLEGRP